MISVRSSTLATFLVDSRAHVDAALERFLPKPPACPPVLSDAMRYSLMAGGKRLRPIMVIAAADAIGRPNDREGLVDLQSAIARILHANASKAAGLTEIDATEPGTYASRWNGFYDAIAARHIVLAERNPDRVRSLMHVAAIEAQLAHGEIKQSEIQAKTGLSPSRLSQVLSLMEAHGMIARRSSGKEKLVRLVRDGTVSEPASSKPAATARRGASYLTVRKAA